MVFYERKEVYDIGKLVYQKQIDPETSVHECFFHYDDKELYLAGFKDGFEAACKYLIKLSKNGEK